MLLSYKTILINKKLLTNNICHFTFKLINPSEINFIPGQYLMIKIPTGNGQVSRLYSIASSSFEKTSFELIIEIVPNGIASNYLSNLKINDEVTFQGPAGLFTLRESNRDKIFLVTGTGIAPVKSIIKSNIKDQKSKRQIKNQKYYLFWGLKTYQDVYLLNELKQYNNEIIEQFYFKICLSRELNLNMISENNKKYFSLGHIDVCFDQYLQNCKLKIENLDYYLCSRREIVDSLKNFLLSKNIPQEQIIFEKF
jgi:NAD(P)H-flavin reductase